MSAAIILPLSWHQRVALYLDDLHNCIEQLNEALYAMRAATTDRVLPQLELSQRRLAETLKSLELMISARHELITAGDAPAAGQSLREILKSAGGKDSDELAARCKQLAKEVELSRERAVAVFVCQFHLSDLSGHLLTLLRGVPSPNATYQQGGAVRRPIAGSGSLLNQSA
jgi:16S rRNA G1207 methylase RsmC